MANIGIFYGSSTGNTKDVSVKLQSAFGADAADLHNVNEITAETISAYRNIVFASSTWGAGDLQDDWEDFFPTLDDVDFSGRKIGLMGLGDQENYSDTFVDGMAVLAEKIREKGGTLVGFTSTEGYNYDNSEADEDGTFIGLVIDEDSQSSLTDERIKAWVAMLKKEFA